jgi:hypothetical protein
MDLYKSTKKEELEGRSNFVPYQSPYEPSFFSLEEDFPGQKFCTWGIFEVVEDANDEVVAKLRADGWAPWDDTSRELFFVLQLQLAQTLIVLEKELPRYWTRTSDIQFAADYPVLLTYQTTDENPLDSLSPDRVHGTCALIEDETATYLYSSDQLGEECVHLLAQIQAGMLVVPYNQFLPQKEVRDLADLRRSHWRQTHEAAQQLAKLYWDFYQRELNSRQKIRNRQLPAPTTAHRTRLPLNNAFIGLAQSFGPGVHLSTWSKEHLNGALQLETPNGSRLRVEGENDWERTALDNYVGGMLGPEGLKHLLVLLDVYYLQTAGRDHETAARVRLKHLLLRLKKGKKAETPAERSKLMHTILYLARTSITAKEYVDEAGAKHQSFAKQQELPQKAKHYSPLLIVDPLKSGLDGHIKIPLEVEYRLGKEFFEALFGARKQYFVVPTAQLLEYHAVREQHELLLAFYLSNRLALVGGHHYVPFTSLLLHSAIQTQETMRQGHDRTRDVKRVLLALEHLERDGLIKRAEHEHIDTVLLMELLTKSCTEGELAPATHARIQDERNHLEKSRPTDSALFARRLANIRLLLDERIQAFPVHFSSGPLLQKQSAAEKAGQAQRTPRVATNRTDGTAKPAQDSEQQEKNSAD